MQCPLCPEIPPAYLEEFCQDWVQRKLGPEEEPYLWTIGSTWLWYENEEWRRDGGVLIDIDEVRGLLKASGGEFKSHTE